MCLPIICPAAHNVVVVVVPVLSHHRIVVVTDATMDKRQRRHLDMGLGLVHI